MSAIRIQTHESSHSLKVHAISDRSRRRTRSEASVLQALDGSSWLDAGEVESLRRVAMHDEDASAKVQATGALIRAAEVDAPLAVAALQSLLLEPHGSGQVDTLNRARAAAAIGRLDLDDELLCTLCCAALSDPNGAVRESVLRALAPAARVGRNGVLETLRAAALSDADAGVRTAALETLAQAHHAGQPTAATALADVLGEADTTTRAGLETWANVEQAFDRAQAQAASPRVIPLADLRRQTLRDLASGISFVEAVGAA